MDYEAVLGTMRAILHKIGVPKDLAESLDENADLLESPVFIDVAGLLYLMFETEKHFGVRLPEHAFDNYGFTSLRKISESVQRLI